MGQAKLEVAVPRHRKAVDLTDGLTRGLHLDHVAVVFFHVDFFYQVGPVNTCGIGFFQHGSADVILLFHAGQGRGFDHELAQLGKAQRKAALIFANARTKVDKPCQGRAVKAGQLCFLDDGGDMPKIGANIARAALGGIGHMGLDAKEL